MPNTISPNMGLIVPGVGTELGPAWANDLNADLGILDQHDHSAGQGAQITPNGLNINSQLSMNSNDLTAVHAITYDNLLTPLPGSSPYLTTTYFSGGELYVNDAVGNMVQITNAGSVNSGAGSITGLPSGTASASYSSGGQKFIWQSATSTSAGMDNGPVTIREQVAGANGVTIQSPSSLAASYSLTFPAALPGSTSFATIDTSGNIGASISTSQGITQSNLANNSVGTAQIIDQNVTQAKLQARATGATVGTGGFAVSASSGAFSTTGGLVTNFDITITTTGRPVVIGIMSDGTGNSSWLGMDYAGYFRLNRDGVEISRQYLQTDVGAAPILVPSSSMTFIDIVAAGTYNYKLVANPDAGPSAQVLFSVFYAYEL